MENKFFISTGEVSGDLHASYLVKNIMNANKSAIFYGVAGEHCKEVGVNIVQDIKELSIMGFVEAIKKYSFLKKKARDYVDLIKKERINKVILVDYGGFNLALLSMLKFEAPNVKVYYYIPPKLWIWGKKRIKKLVQADSILVIFPWEVEFYKSQGVEAIYYGNPFCEKYKKIEERGEEILLLPGSRKQEIQKILPTMLEVVKTHPHEKFFIKLSSVEHKKWIKENLNKYSNLEVVTIGTLEESVKKAKIAIATSGTVTLELALLGVPTIVVYKTSWINAFIVKTFLNVGFVSLPNLTVNREVFPELLQHNCTEKNISHKLNEILDNKDKIKKDIDEVRKVLGGNVKNITECYANYILEGNNNEN